MIKKRAPEPLTKILASPARVFLIAVISIFLSESVVMLVLAFLPPLTIFKEALLDSLILTVMLIPLLVFIIYRPLQIYITELKKANDVLHMSEKRFRDIAENSLEWIWEVDSEGKYTYASPVVEKILGYKPEEVLGKFFYDFIRTEERGEIKKSVYEVFSQKKYFNNILNNKVHKNGNTVICETSGVPIISNNGELRGYRGAVRDISARKRAEEALRDSREMAKAISDTSMDAIIMMDGKGFISYFNPVAEEIFGYKREEAVGRKLHSFLVSEKSREEYYKKLPTFEKTGQCEKVGKTLELYGNKKDGSRFPLEISVSSFQIKGEWHAVGMVRDITRRKNMEIELEKAAITDELTGLLNRRGFLALSEQQFKYANRNRIGISLMYADLDNLKGINDKFGHKEGDQAIIDTARILMNTFRESDIVGRLGGDEFAVLLTGPSKPDIAELCVNHVQDNLKFHNKGGNRGYELSLSMGVVYRYPKTSFKLDELLIEADKMMYEKKRPKKNVV